MGFYRGEARSLTRERFVEVLGVHWMSHSWSERCLQFASLEPVPVDGVEEVLVPDVSVHALGAAQSGPRILVQ